MKTRKYHIIQEGNDPDKPCPYSNGHVQSQTCNTQPCYGGTCTNGNLLPANERIFDNQCGSCRSGFDLIDHWTEEIGSGNLRTSEDYCKCHKCECAPNNSIRGTGMLPQEGSYCGIAYVHHTSDTNYAGLQWNDTSKQVDC